MSQVEKINQTIQLDNGVEIALQWLIPSGWEQSDTVADIVLLHEALGCIGMWKDFPEMLAGTTGRRVMVYDREGYGNSSPLRQERNPDYLHLYAEEELPAVLEKCNIEKPILFGHSDGGSIAMLYAAKFDPLAIITEAGHVFVEDVTVKGIVEAVSLWNSTNLEERLAKYHGTKTKQIFDAWAVTWQTEDFLKWNMEEESKSISCPTLILQGAEDEYGTEAQVESILSHVSGPVRATMLPDCKHIPHLQAQEEVLRLTNSFLQEL